MKFALLFAWHLTFMAPSHRAVNCREVADTLVNLCAFEVWRQRQSPTWIARKSEVLGSASAWVAWWPVIAHEAEPARFASFTSGSAEAGTMVALALPDTVARGFFYRVRVVAADSSRSCLGGYAWR